MSGVASIHLRCRAKGVRHALVATAALWMQLLAPMADADMTTLAAGPTRMGWYGDEPWLQPAAAALTVGPIFDAPVVGQVYATPLSYHGSLLVVTEANRVYWLDPQSGSVKDSVTLPDMPFDPSDLGCGDLVPTVGITGTPVIDASTDTAYFVSKGYASGNSGPVVLRMHAFDVQTHTERLGFPVTIHGSAQNAPQIDFDPTHALQRPGLLLSAGVVYASFGSHCDIAPYSGWVVGIDARSGRIDAMWNDEATDTTQTIQGWAGIWMAGGAPASDALGTMLVVTGNGQIPRGPEPGQTDPGAFGNAVVRLRARTDGALAATDFFIPYDAQSLNDVDADLGSGGVTLLPEDWGTPQHRHLAVVEGKSGVLYLLDRDNLGGYQQGPKGADAVLQKLGAYTQLFGQPSVWPGDGGYVYMAQGPGPADRMGNMLAFRRAVPTNGASPHLTFAGRSKERLGWAFTPVVTSSALETGTATLWVERMPERDGVDAELLAYDPVPRGGELKLLNRWSLTANGTQVGQKLSSPGVDSGRLYVTTHGTGAAVDTGHVRCFAPFAPPALGRVARQLPRPPSSASSASPASAWVSPRHASPKRKLQAAKMKETTIHAPRRASSVSSSARTCARCRSA
jgi:hypothetical protein